jgi:hypothetical protein
LVSISIRQSGPDLVGGKPAILKESRLLCTLDQALRQAAGELAASDLRGQPIPIDLRFQERPIDRLICNPLLAELGPNPDGALPALCMVVYESRYEAVIGDEPLRTELRNDSFDGLRVMTLRRQLPLQLLGAMFAPRKQAYSRNLDRFVIRSHDRLEDWRLARSARSRAPTIRCPLSPIPYPTSFFIR